jgi:beta-glucosidase-like glycosyl hydrolase
MLTYRAFSQLARAESAVGLRCSDVLVDYNFDRRNAAMNNRTLGADMAVIMDQARAMTRALQDNGIIPVIKHFPCQSWGSTDTHFEIMKVPLTIEEMEKTVFPPYRQILNNTMTVMLSHATFSAVDDKLPTTLSPAVVTGLLRDRIGFDGMIMTDSITMASILDYYPIPQACVMALKAGVDQILLKAEDYFSSSIQAVEEAVKSGEITEAHLNRSYERIMNLKNEYGITHPFTASEARIESALHAPQTQALWTGVCAGLTRALRAEPGDLPLKPYPGDKWLIIEGDENRLDTYCNDEWHHANILAKALEKRFPMVKIEKRLVPYCESAAEAQAHIRDAEKFKKVIVGAYSTRIRPAPLGVSRALGEKDIAHIAVTNNPFNADPTRLSEKARTVICPFGFFRFPILGAVAMLSGDIPVNSNVSSELAQNGADAWQK